MITPRTLTAATAVLALTLGACSSTRSTEVMEATQGISDRVVHLMIAACNPVRTDVEAEEAPDEVRVLVTVTDPSETEDCAAGANVHLDEPLGDRPLVDASTNQAVEVMERW